MDGQTAGEAPWILKYEDRDVGDRYFTNRADAVKAYESASLTWNCHLYAPYKLLSALEAERDQLKAIKTPDTSFTYCAFCGEKSPVDEHNEDLSAHIKVCPKHPMRDVEREREALRGQVKDAERRLGRIETRCPSCQNTTLFISDHGALVCSWLGCKNPVPERFVADLQAEREALKGELKELSDHDEENFKAYADAMADNKRLQADLARLRQALDDIRDSVLHGRGPLAEMDVDNDITNAVLGIIDDHMHRATHEPGGG